MNSFFECASFKLHSQQMSSSPGEGDLAREYLFPSTLNLDNIALEFNRTVVAMTPAERS